LKQDQTQNKKERKKRKEKGRKKTKKPGLQLHIQYLTRFHLP
jgi:hypothetical protein